MDKGNNSGARGRGRHKRVTGPANSGAQPDAPKDLRIGLKLSTETLEIFGKLLAEIPYKVAQPIIADLSVQIDAHKKGSFNEI